MSKEDIFGRFKNQPQRPPRAPSIAMDRLGRVIEQGHLVMFHSDVDLVFEVVDIRPVLDPSQPGGVMQMTLRSEFNVGSPSGSVNRMTVIVGESQAMLAAKAANNGQGAELQKAYESTLVGKTPPAGIASGAMINGILGVHAYDPDRSYLVDDHGGITAVDDPPEPLVCGRCPACGHEIRRPIGVSEACSNCGDAVYRPVQD